VPQNAPYDSVLNAGLELDSTTQWKTWEPQREKVFGRMLEQYRGQPAHFLEIGSFEGASAIWLMQNVLTHPESTMTCVDDNSLGRQPQMLRNLRTAGFEARTRLHWINSHEIRSHVPDNRFDFVYVDGSHAAPSVMFDVVNAYLIVKPGGLVGCDDYLFTKPEAGSVPKPAIDAFLALMGDRVEVVHSGYQLWFRKRPLAA